MEEQGFRQKADHALGVVQQGMKLGFVLFLVGVILFVGLFFVAFAKPFSPATTAQDVIRDVRMDALRTGTPITIYVDGQGVQLPLDTDLSQLLQPGQWDKKWFEPKAVSGTEVVLFADDDPAEECSLRIYPEAGLARVYDWWGPTGRETVWYTIPDSLADTLLDSILP